MWRWLANTDVNGICIFNIEAPPEAEIDTLFDQQNMFTEDKDTYGLVIGYPDDFNYEMAPEVDSLMVSFAPQDEEVAYIIMLKVFAPKILHVPLQLNIFNI